MIQRTIERLLALPRRNDDAWQGAIVRMPSWIAERGEKAYRPWIALWVSLKSGKIHMSEMVRPEGKTLDLAIDALYRFAANRDIAGYCPSELQVADHELYQHLSTKLAGGGIAVRLREKLFTLDRVLDDFARSMAKRRFGGAQADVPDAREARYVTVERLRAFADAAAAYYRAAPWRLLWGEDAIRIVSPSTFPAMQCASVLGADQQVFGLCLYESEAQHQACSTGEDLSEMLADSQMVSMTFNAITEIPLSDADLFEDYRLPAAAPQAYPFLVRHGPAHKLHRLDARALAYVEGLLRALADSSESNLDDGEWQKTVTTADGKMEFKLAIPGLLEPIDETPPPLPDHGGFDAHDLQRLITDVHRLVSRQRFRSQREQAAFLASLEGRVVPPQPPLTPLERAEDLAYVAHRAVGRRRIKILRHALAISPDCAEAYALLAENTNDPAQALELFKQGMVAGERALGPKFAKHKGRLWEVIPARPSLRARFGLANCLQLAGKLDEASEHYRALLDLDEDDHVGARYPWLCCQLRLGRQGDPDLVRIARRYRGDDSARWSYCQALLAFSRRGNSAAARKHLAAALETNRFVPALLLDRSKMPGELPEVFNDDDRNGAVVCAFLLRDVWEAVPGALEWLRQCVVRRRPKSPRIPKGREQSTGE